jgi:hypothetical protein
MTIYELYIDSLRKKQGLVKFVKNENRNVIEASIASSVVTSLCTNSLEVVVIRK